MTTPLTDATSALSGLTLHSQQPPPPSSKTAGCAPLDVSSITSLARDLSDLSLKSPSKRKAASTSHKGKKKPPSFRYRVGGGSGPRARVPSNPKSTKSQSASRPPSRPSSRTSRPPSRSRDSPSTKKKGKYNKHGHVHVRIEPRSRRHAMHRRHRVPSPTPTV